MNDLRHPDVEYFRMPGLAKDMFRCSTWRANLVVDFCAGRWKKAQTARGEEADKLRLCAICPIGPTHAGERYLPRAPGFQTNICPRCRKGSGRRLIGGRLCINCYNREREWLIGRNSKGSVPVRLNERFGIFRVGVILDPDTPEENRAVFTDIAIDARELELRVERLHLGAIAFCDPGAPGEFPEWKPKGMQTLAVRLENHPVKAKELFAAGNAAPANKKPAAAPLSIQAARLRRALHGASCLTPFRFAAADLRAA